MVVMVVVMVVMVVGMVVMVVMVVGMVVMVAIFVVDANNSILRAVHSAPRVQVISQAPPGCADMQQRRPFCC